MYMMIRTQVLFPKDLLMDLQDIAVLEKKSVSEILRALASDKVKKKNKKKLTGIEVLKRMAERARRYKGPQAPRDLSTNDEYLYGKDAP